MAAAFFADHCVPMAVINDLREAGHEVLLLKDHLPTTSPDEVVIKKAGELGAVLISLDGDFADIVRFPPSRYQGIVGLQVRNHPGVIHHIMSRLMDFLSTQEGFNLSGKLILVEPDRIRIR